MDHKSFETTMIEYVNRNAQAEEENRNEHFREKQESIAQRRRKKLTKAVIEYILWAVVLIGIVYVMSFTYLTDLIQTDVAVTVASLFAFVAGLRMHTLAIRIERYGGR